MGAGIPARGPEPPDLADKSSQSSLTSLDDTGLTKHVTITSHVVIHFTSWFFPTVLKEEVKVYCLLYVLSDLVSPVFELGAGFPGDNKDAANGETTGQSSKKSSATRMVTRLRNPESKLSQLKNQQVAAAVHEANKGFKEGKEVKITVDDDNFGLSVNE